MDSNGVKFNYLWSNGFNRSVLKSNNNSNSQNQGTNIVNPSRLSNSPTSLIHSRLFTSLIVCLVIIISLNLVLSFWIIRSLQIGNGGLGDGKLLPTLKRMTVKAPARFNGWLIGEDVNPVHRDQWISIIGSSKSLNLVDYGINDTGQDVDQFENTVLSLNEEKIEYQGPKMVVTSEENGSKRVLFSVDSDQMITDSPETLTSANWGGLDVKHQLETATIKGDFYHDLRLESRMKGISIDAQSNLAVQSRAGSVHFNSFKDLSFSSDKSLKIDSSKVHLKSLVKRKSHRHDGSSYRKEAIAYQVCLCDSGRLFLSSANSACLLSHEACSSSPDDPVLDEVTYE